MEPFIALLLTVGIAGVIGLRRGSRRKLAEERSSAVAEQYDEYLHALSAAGLVHLSNVVGDTPKAEDIQQSINGSRLISQMIGLLEGQRAEAVITDMRAGRPDTVGALLTSLSGDAEKYWPERAADLHRARESLS